MSAEPPHPTPSATTRAPAADDRRHPRDRPGGRADVLVLGGGIIGLACARELAGRGASVALVERRQRLGQESSRAGAGLLAPLFELPELPPLFAAARLARDRWPAWQDELVAETGLDGSGGEVGVDHDPSGALALALDDAEEAFLDRLEATARRLGEQAETLGTAELRRRIPALAPRVRRGLLLPGEHRVDNERVCAALAIACEQRGVVLHAGQEATAVEVGAGSVTVSGDGWAIEADRLLVAAGAWSGRIAGLPELPVRPVKGQMLRLAGVDWPWRGIVRGPDLYAVRRSGGQLLLGATLEEVGYDRQVTVEGMERLVSWCRRLFPGLSGHPIADSWAGLRPGSADDLPIVGPLAISGEADRRVFAATGHYRNGILLAPWTAEVVADMLLEGRTDPLAAAFAPDRFEGEGERGQLVGSASSLLRTIT